MVRPCASFAGFSSVVINGFDMHTSQGAGSPDNAKQYTAKIKQSRSWQEAIDWLKDMERNSIQPNLFHFNTAISVCARKRNWQIALKLLRVMGNRGMQPDVFSYCSAISACDKSVHNRKKAFVISYNAAISACEKGKQWEQAVKLMREIQPGQRFNCKL